LKRKQNSHIQPSALEKQLLATYFSGFYLTHKNIIETGKNNDIELPYKKRSVILQELFIKAKKAGKYKNVLSDFIKLIDENIASFNKYAQNYPYASSIIKRWIHKANSTKALLQRELGGSLYE